MYIFIRLYQYKHVLPLMSQFRFSIFFQVSHRVQPKKALNFFMEGRHIFLTLTKHEVVYIAADAAGAGRAKLGESPVGTNALQAPLPVVSEMFFLLG